MPSTGAMPVRRPAHLHRSTQSWVPVEIGNCVGIVDTRDRSDYVPKRQELSHGSNLTAGDTAKPAASGLAYRAEEALTLWSLPRGEAERGRPWSGSSTTPRTTSVSTPLLVEPAIAGVCQKPHGTSGDAVSAERGKLAR
jgi:hypothetical protein